jgi:15-cis-phytoene desaturase
MPSFDTVVTGGGLAGITAAVALANAGQRVALLEAASILGGRASSTIDATTGDAIAIGPHVLFSEYANFLKLLRLLDTESNVVWEDERFSTEVKGTHEMVMRMSRLPAPFHFVPSLWSDRTLRNADWLSNAGITLYALSLREDDLMRLDRERGIDVVRRFRVREAYIDRFWRYLSLAIVNVPLDECSAGALLRAYRRLIGKRGYRIGFPDGGLGDLFGPAALRFLRERGAVVRMDARVVSFEGPMVLSSGEVFEGASYIRAFPPAALERVPYVSVYLWFDRHLTSRRFWSRVFAEGDLNLDFYDFSNIGTRRGASLIGSNVIGAARVGTLTDAEILQRTLEEIVEYLPHAREARVVHSVVHRIPMAIHAAVPGSERARPRDVEVRRGVVVAGDWTQTGLPPSMESACFSGFRAAEVILGRRDLAVRHRELDWFAALLGWVTRLVH